jgi:flagellar hook-associated protein 1
VSGTFGGLSTALSALYSQRRGLEVAGQNIANANTEGYSRQKLTLASVGAPSSPAVFAVGDPAGGGVTPFALVRIRDEFLESQARADHATSAYLSDQKQVFGKVEDVIGEPSDTGLQSQLAEYWSAWQSVTNQAGDSAARTALIEKGVTLTDSLRGSYEGISSLWDSTREQLDASVTEINTTATTVAQLNAAVVRTKGAGLPGNELADQRDLGVLRLSELTGGRAVARADGSVDVLVDGSSLVSGANTRTLVASGATQLRDQAANPVALSWADTGAAAYVSSGSLASTMQSLNVTLTGVAGSIDSVAASLATTVNTQHTLGFDLNGAPGVDFFAGTTAETIKVAITDPAQVAASAVAPTPPATASLDGANADAIAALGTSLTGPDSTYRQFVANLGIQAQSINRRADIQSTITTDADSSRIAQSGVNLDEEMTDLLQFQRAYEAAAKVTTTIDATLASLMNLIR